MARYPDSRSALGHALYIAQEECGGWVPHEAVKDVVKSSGLKMPQLAMPLRQIVTGRTQTPSIDAVLELLGREVVLHRLTRSLDTD